MFISVVISAARVLFECALYNVFYELLVSVQRCREATQFSGKPILSSNVKKALGMI